MTVSVMVMSMAMTVVFMIVSPFATFLTFAGISESKFLGSLLLLFLLLVNVTVAMIMIMAWTSM